MVELSYSESFHVLCARASGTNQAADHQKLLAAVDELDRNGRAKAHPIAFVLDLAPDCQPPDAYWRKRFAEQRKGFKAPKVFTAVITTSTILRGVLTAMNWVSADPPHVRSVHHATFDEAAAWIQATQGTSVAALRSLAERIGGPDQKAS
jgi:hypothetical protein